MKVKKKISPLAEKIRMLRQFFEENNFEADACFIEGYVILVREEATKRKKHLFMGKKSPCE